MAIPWGWVLGAGAAGLFGYAVFAPKKPGRSGYMPGDLATKGDDVLVPFDRFPPVRIPGLPTAAELPFPPPGYAGEGPSIVLRVVAEDEQIVYAQPFGYVVPPAPSLVSLAIPQGTAVPVVPIPRASVVRVVRDGKILTL